ncbi:hypothetical protein FB451DRAFT_1190963 [Mycena latifolia]|nr:hypothetical protein FB451DRAFT_1190963 [Mycena latifolia]
MQHLGLGPRALTKLCPPQVQCLNSPSETLHLFCEPARQNAKFRTLQVKSRFCAPNPPKTPKNEICRSPQTATPPRQVPCPPTTHFHSQTSSNSPYDVLRRIRMILERTSPLKPRPTTCLRSPALHLSTIYTITLCSRVPDFVPELRCEIPHLVLALRSVPPAARTLSYSTRRTVQNSEILNSESQNLPFNLRDLGLKALEGVVNVPGRRAIFCVLTPVLTIDFPVLGYN